MVGKRGVVRRVYESVEFSKVPSGYTVLLDSKPLKTPKVVNNQFVRVCYRTCTFIGTWSYTAYRGVSSCYCTRMGTAGRRDTTSLHASEFSSSYCYRQPDL